MDLNFKNLIWISGAIDNKEFYTAFTRRFSEIMSSTSGNDQITVFINSPGGESYTALGMLHTQGHH